ncbi:tripartite tricarboxylate transporter TctB family protein [Paracoccus sp. (in: a-proteobacteria)]|uniref:tripartite tricarboxylate transporter TctB family protein n=1 Tax=Paracoccus sp. TaxID=267 RepID=UPI003A856D49
MTTDAKLPELPTVARRTGDTAFNAVCLLVSLFLFSQMWSQTTWAPGQIFAAQPGFWPRLAVIGMVLFSALNLYGSIRDPHADARLTALGEEVLLWLRSVEFGLWFMAYVFATPVIGYLPASVLFAIALTLRVGYRSGQALVWAAVAAAATVLLFKSFLQVKIPGGAVYQTLPDGLRNLFVLYL